MRQSIDPNSIDRLTRRMALFGRLVANGAADMLDRGWEDLLYWTARNAAAAGYAELEQDAADHAHERILGA